MQKVKEIYRAEANIVFFLSYKILKISTRQDRQLRMRRNCHATLGTRFQVCLFQVYFVGRFFRPDDFHYV